MPPRRKTSDIDPARVVKSLPSGYAHVGLYDVKNKKAFAARDDLSRPAIDLHHAELFSGQRLASAYSHGGGGGGGGDAGTAGSEGVVVKDRFLCFWFYPPHTREGALQGYPVDWSEHNLLVRLDPRWNYQRQLLLSAHQIAAIDANINAQVNAATHLMTLYRAHGLGEPLSLHMIGPRATDSLFYAKRWEPKY